MRCNLTEAEQKAALEVPFRCTGEEQEFIERCFIGYLFFEHEADENGRLGVTTECTRCGRKVWWTEREWKRFKQENDVKARSNLLCPDCGCGVTLYPRGRLRNGNALDEYRQVVLLRAIDGAGSRTTRRAAQRPPTTSHRASARSGGENGRGARKNSSTRRGSWRRKP